MLHDDDDVAAEERRKNFEERQKEEEAVVEKWAEQGIDVSCSHNNLKINEVYLNFSDEEWCETINREGEYLGVCCADISRIRDVLTEVLRNDSRIDAHDLREIAEIIKSHNDDDGSNPDNPLSKIVNLYNKIKDDLDDSVHNSLALDMNDPKDCLHALSRCADYISMDDLFQPSNDPGTRMQCDAGRLKSLAVITGVVKTLYEKLEELNTKRSIVEGYGPAKLTDKIWETLSSRNGLAIYQDKEQAEEQCRLLMAENNHIYTAKKIRVTFEHGVEVLSDDVELSEDYNSIRSQKDRIERRIHRNEIQIANLKKELRKIRNTCKHPNKTTDPDTGEWICRDCDYYKKVK